MILSKIIDQEKLEISNDALKGTYQEVAQNYLRPVEEIEAFYNENPDKIGPLKYALLEKQAIKLIIESGQVEDVSVSPVIEEAQ